MNSNDSQIRSRALTVAFQAPNRVGLGHISRMMAVALAIRRRRPDARLPFILEGASHSLLETASLPYFSLPHREEMAGPSWTAWNHLRRANMVFDMSRAILRCLQPDMVLCDTFPCMPFMAAAAKLRVPLALCARKTRYNEAYWEGICKHGALLSLILIPHDPGEVWVPASLRSSVRFVGEISRPISGVAAPPCVPGSKRIVITGGGGGYEGTVHFYNLAMDAFVRYRRDHPDTGCVLVTGPLFREWWDLRMVDGVRVVPFEPNLRELMATADLVICQAGYNTASEIRRLGVPSICMPGERLADDQEERAVAMAGSLPGFHVFLGNDAGELAQYIARALHTEHRASAALPPNGADRAADLLLSCIAEQGAHRGAFGQRASAGGTVRFIPMAEQEALA